MTRIIGLMPARMAASRFPGKPLFKLLGRPMLEHCFLRAQLFPRWDLLAVCTCDTEIDEFATSKGFPSIWTKNTHTRALDRVAEAASKCGIDLAPDDIVVCVQGDEPMMRPEMIEAVVNPFFEDVSVRGTMLGVHIVDESLWHNPDIVKIVHDQKGNVLYTSRSPVPYAKQFSPELEARRVGGIFGFRWEALQWFTQTPESPLEKKESCDSNRIPDNGWFQRLAPFPAVTYFSVDSPSDAGLVEGALEADPYWGKY
jgi:3-deoxy-manno-octulosonate cytidylyltransferase (CMP-KDO synthetase)